MYVLDHNLLSKTKELEFILLPYILYVHFQKPSGMGPLFSFCILWPFELKGKVIKILRK